MYNDSIISTPWYTYKELLIWQVKKGHTITETRLYNADPLNPTFI